MIYRCRERLHAGRLHASGLAAMAQVIEEKRAAAAEGQELARMETGAKKTMKVQRQRQQQARQAT